MANETKWTPGPWRVKYRDPNGNRKENVAIVAGEGRDEHDIIGGCGDCGSAWCTNEADARLIAAAPDLVEALALAYGAMCHMGDVLNEMDVVEQKDVDKTLSAFEAARMALAKAQGN